MKTAMQSGALLPLLLGVAGIAHAQSAGSCPDLPAAIGLSWEHRAGPGYDFCSALYADRSQAFTVYIGRESPFKPHRGNREERGMLDGREIRWYRGEIAAEPGAQVRETLIELADGRVAHIWLRAPDATSLARQLEIAENLRFRAMPISGR
jgi:hypothetical protein